MLKRCFYGKSLGGLIPTLIKCVHYLHLKKRLSGEGDNRFELHTIHSAQMEFYSTLAFIDVDNQSINKYEFYSILNLFTLTVVGTSLVPPDVGPQLTGGVPIFSEALSFAVSN